MNMYIVMGILAGLFALSDNVLYIAAMYKRDYHALAFLIPVRWASKLESLGIPDFHTRIIRWRSYRVKANVPNRATWFIWATVGIILVSSYGASGATTTIFFPISYAVAFIVTALISIRRGEGGFKATDLLSLVVAAFAGWAWWRFDSPQIALFATLTMDLSGAVPTVKKSWLEPWKENRLAWTLGFFGAVANVFAVNWAEATFAVGVYPIAMLVEMGLITGILYIRSEHPARATRSTPAPPKGSDLLKGTEQ